MIARVIAAAADRAEQERRIPDDVLGQLDAAGYLRMALPARHGGAELSLLEMLGELRHLARADASIAWTVMVWAQSQIILARLKREVYEEVVDSGSAVLVAATAAGSGDADAAEDRLVLDGEWAFASGVSSSNWVLVHCRVPTADGRRLFGALLPRAAVEVDDVWHVLGLRATGSNTVHAHGVLLDRCRLYELDGPPGPAATLHNALPTRPSFALHMAAVALGTAEGAMEDLRTHLSKRDRASYAGHSAEDAGRQHMGVGIAQSDLTAALAGVEALGREAWTQVVQGRNVDERLARAMSASASRTVQTAVETVLWAFAESGTAALFDTHPLQRRLRDVLTLAQHANVSTRNLVALGESVFRVSG